jgi:hypothetical protein
MYFMRGALSRESMLDLTSWEKDILSEFLNERIEIEMQKKNTPPIY